jgi:hypothetical protein
MQIDSCLVPREPLVDKESMLDEPLELIFKEFELFFFDSIVNSNSNAYLTLAPHPSLVASTNGNLAVI